MSWQEWHSIVNDIIVRSIGISAEALIPQPPLREWWLEKVNPVAAARWAMSEDNG